MAKRVFNPPEAERWPKVKTNAFMKKYLTLIPTQKIYLESDLYQEPFLKEFEKNPSYKQAFDFKTKMFRSLKFQRTEHHSLEVKGLLIGRILLVFLQESFF